VYVFILQQDNTQNIKPEGQQGSEALTAARNKFLEDNQEPRPIGQHPVQYGSGQEISRPISISGTKYGL